MMGKVFGNYRVAGELGTGGMGVVYRAEHTLIGRQAALKVLLPRYSQDREVVNRFFNEARAASAINNPGIVEVLDFGFTNDGNAYILMEYLEGESLKTRLKRAGVVPFTATLQLGRQLARSLAAAHDLGIVHRDIKPDNIFLVADPEVTGGERTKLLDFGIAKLDRGDQSQHQTRAGMIVGTPAYMAPEQCKGTGNVDSRADIYALGCVLFEMLSGRGPFIAAGPGEIMAQHIYVEPPRLTSVAAPSVPPYVRTEVDGLLLAMLAKNPDQRPPSGAAVVASLDALLARAPHDHPRAASVGGVGTAAMPGPHRGPLQGAAVQTTLGRSTTSMSGYRPAPAQGYKFVVALAVLALSLAGLGVYRWTTINAQSPIAETADDGVAVEALAVADEVSAGPAQEPENIETADAGSTANPLIFLVDSSPHGAQVFRGGELVGDTPHEVTLAAGESQKLEIRLKGYVTYPLHLPEDAVNGTKTVNLQEIDAPAVPQDPVAKDRHDRADADQPAKKSPTRDARRKRARRSNSAKGRAKAGSATTGKVEHTHEELEDGASLKW